MYLHNDKKYTYRENVARVPAGLAAWSTPAHLSLRPRYPAPHALPLAHHGGGNYRQMAQGWWAYWKCNFPITPHVRPLVGR